MTTIIRAADPAQFLALVPHLLGYTPTRSVVLIPFAGNRSAGGMRLDLPADPAVDSSAATMIGFLCRLPGLTSVAVVVFTDRRPAGPGSATRAPHAELVDALLIRADACGIGVKEALYTTDAVWGSYFDESAPRPLSELATPSATTSVAAPDGDQHTGGTLPQARPDQRARMVAASDEIDKAIESLVASGRRSEKRVDPAALCALEWFEDPTTLFEAVLGWDPEAVDPVGAAALSRFLQMSAPRFVALIQWATSRRGGELAFEADDRWEEDGDDAMLTEICEPLWGRGARPDTERLSAALAVLRRVAADAPEPEQAHLIAVCAWLSWALGRSTHAAHLASRALARDEDSTIAQMVSGFVARGHFPDWAFAAPAPAAT